MGGVARVSIVEAGDLEPLGDERVEEPGGSQHHRDRGTHDEEEGLALIPPQSLVDEF
jgi:hypothetical protein